ncbi:MAG: hypothetical protein CVV06_15660 [Gammaproteobacteria bacterium HGW-Gammaproteobacteria-10]|nr:MAG: hypothetical protein CVV06_15660 [Gammaproteobacteria bacterium HGW-Gammaproteobacteria-10]
MKVWGVASEDVGAGQIFAPAKSAFTPSMAFDCCRQAPMDGSTAVLNRHISYLLFFDGFSIKREWPERFTRRVIYAVNLRYF